MISALRSSCKVPVILVRFNETWIYSADFREVADIKFHENPSGGNRVVLCGQMDRRDETDGPLINFSNKPKNQSVNVV